MNKENKEKVKSNICPICKRPVYKSSKYCIFHASAEEKTNEEFKKALKEYINETKKEDKSRYGVKSLQADREFKNITLYKSDSVKVSQVGYLFDIKIVYLCEMA